MPRRLRGAVVADAARVIARAFDDDQFFRLLVPNPVQRALALEFVSELAARAALPYGHVFAVSEGDRGIQGVAIWWPPGVRPGMLRPLLHLAVRAPRLRRTGWHVLRQFARLFVKSPGAFLGYRLDLSRAMRAARRRPAWYLAVLAVDPPHQRMHVGSRLLEHVLERCDADDALVSLQCEPHNVPYYERFGFVVAATIAAPAGLPPTLLMTRSPSSR